MEDRHLNLLLVDDDAVDVMTVERVFHRNNLTPGLYVARNGLEALAMLRGEEPLPKVPAQRRWVLLDLNMPKMVQSGSCGSYGRMTICGQSLSLC